MNYMIYIIFSPTDRGGLLRRPLVERRRQR
jgi:hypothetical protein